MTNEELLNRLDMVRPRGMDQWSARCPAHTDRTPSLSIRAGARGWLLKCWAGCTVEEICEALGCRVADLFLERRSQTWKRKAVSPRPPRFDWQATAWRFRFHAMLLWLRAEEVLKAAREENPSRSSIEDNDAAMGAVANAYQDIERADFLEEVAFGIRAEGLAKEQHAYHSDAA